MAIEVRVPEMGESIVEAVIGNWLKREGDAVSAGEALVELETEKVNIEVAAERSGVLERILKREGETVSVGEVIAVIAEGVAAEAPAARPAVEPARPVAEPQPVTAEVPAAPVGRAVPAEALSIRATPAVRRLAEGGLLRGQEVNIGGIHHAPGREGVLPYVYLSPEERRELERLAQQGVTVSARDLPGSRKVDLPHLLGRERPEP